MTDTTIRTEERCEKSDLLQSQCAHCRPNPEGEWLAAALGSQPADDTAAFRQADDPVLLGPPFKAHYVGICRHCPAGIHKGDLIQPTDYGYVHVECP